MMCWSLITRDLSLIYQLLSQFVCDGCVYSQRVATLNSRTEFGRSVHTEASIQLYYLPVMGWWLLLIQIHSRGFVEGFPK